ncbi:MAG: tetratricopeptide repeat protein [Cyanobacteria bacterium P01_E01_bin.34]
MVGRGIGESGWGRYFAALEALEKGLEIEPESLQGLFDLGNTHLLLENFDEARAAYETSLGIDEEFWPAINNIGLLEYQIGNVEESIPQFEASIALDDTAAEPVLALATALYVLGETERATELGVQAIQLDFTYGDIQTLRDNLWGNELIRDVQVLLEERDVRDALNQARADSQLQELNNAF